MDCFNDLEKSAKLDDKVIYCFLINFLDLLCGKHDQIIIDNNCETETNKQLLEEQWKIIEIYFKVPKRVKSTQRCVRQTLKHIVDYLNSKYQFKNPIKFTPVKKNVWQNNKCISICYTEVVF